MTYVRYHREVLPLPQQAQGERADSSPMQMGGRPQHHGLPALQGNRVLPRRACASSLTTNLPPPAVWRHTWRMPQQQSPQAFSRGSSGSAMHLDISACAGMSSTRRSGRTCGNSPSENRAWPLTARSLMSGRTPTSRPRRLKKPPDRTTIGPAASAEEMIHGAKNDHRPLREGRCLANR